MISISTSKIESILKTNQTEVESIIHEKETALQAFITTPDRPGAKASDPRIPIVLTAAQTNYLNLLRVHFTEIVKAKPDRLKYFKTRFESIISGENMRTLGLNKHFKNELIKRLGYSELRSEHYPKHFTNTGIKACIYCNAQLAISAESKGKKRIAKFQVDHYYPKSEYPCFSISYYNLYPSCGPCNGRKSSKPIEFDLYSNDPDNLKTSKFTFELDRRSIVKYRINGITEELKIKFNDPKKIGFNDSFDIEGIYETQKDLAEELVLKSIIYDKSYLKQLQESFKVLYPEKVPIAGRLVSGNYTDEKDIHKRPMAKFTQDIAKQLKLI